MRCPECGADFDELNESQPVCPGCGCPPGSSGDYTDCELAESLEELTRMPPDLQEALDDAEALLLATGNVGFRVPGKGFWLFTLPTDRVM